MSKNKCIKLKEKPFETDAVKEPENNRNLVMRISAILSILTFVFLLGKPVAAQSDSTEISNPYGATKLPGAFKLKPRLGLGAGSLVFYGDLGGDNRGYHPGSADMAFMLSLTNDITSYLDVSLYTLFGTIHVNEYTNPRRLNMQSQVRSGGIMFNYNFDHFLPENRGAEPYIGIGFESFEFLSKTDLYDDNGYRYHYWSDGTIRNMAEGAPGADEALLLERNYVYETDLRDLNLDGLGAYPDRSFAVPIAAGVQFRVTDRFRVKLGARYMLTFTDRVDNITSESTGVRQSDGRNDRFLYSHCTVNYDLNPLRMKPKRKHDIYIDEGDKDLMASLEDTDGDGVPDLIDRCPGTPDGAPVDKYGCPLDSDGDGIPDYRDEEPYSPHTYVDAEGVALDDDEIYQRHLMWQDSIPWVSKGPLNEAYARVEADASKAKEVYRVRIPRKEGGMSQEEINALLAQTDIISGQDGDVKFYMVGAYDDVPGAVKRKIQLDRSGITGGDVVKTNENNSETPSPIEADPVLEAEMAEQLDQEGYEPLIDVIAEVIEEDTEADVLPTNEADLAGNESNGLIYRVQVGAFRGELSENIFGAAGTIIAVPGDDGLTRYVTEATSDMRVAIERKTELLTKGYEGAFIVAYKDGKRVTLAEAGMTVTDPAKDLTVDKEVSPVDTSLIKFRPVYGEYTDDIPTDQLEALLELGNIQPRRLPDGTTLFLGEMTDTYDSVEDSLQRASELGISGTRVAGEFNRRFIPVEDALLLKPVTPVSTSQAD